MRDPRSSGGQGPLPVDVSNLARELVDTLPFALLITDPDGGVLAANRRGHDIFGYDPEEIRSQSLPDLLPDLAAQMEAIVGPHGRPSPEDLARFGPIHWGCNRHGSRFPADVEVSPVQAGGQDLVAVSVKDLSGWGGRSRKMFHPRVASMILQSLDLAVVGVAPDGSILSWNEAAEELYGFTEAEALGRSTGLLTPSDATDDIAGNMSSVLSGDTPGPFLTDHLTKHDDPLSVLVVMAAIRDEEEDAIGASVALTPFTQPDQGRTPDHLASLPAFHQLAAHDLREPLRMVTGYLDLLERRAGDDLDDAARSYISSAREGAQRLGDQLEGLRRLSQPSGPEADMEATDMSRPLDRALKTLARSIEEHGAQVTHEPMPTALADGPLIEEVFQNLISNALRFVPEGRAPRVAIGARRVDGAWVIRVEDNGIGVPKQDREAVFVPFHRLHSRAEVDGEGLGLSICQLILETHGGRIWVEDSELGGAAFCFTLPAADQEAPGNGNGAVSVVDPALA